MDAQFEEGVNIPRAKNSEGGYQKEMGGGLQAKIIYPPNSEGYSPAFTHPSQVKTITITLLVKGERKYREILKVKNYDNIIDPNGGGRVG